MATEKRKGIGALVALTTLLWACSTGGGIVENEGADAPDVREQADQTDELTRPPLDAADEEDEFALDLVPVDQKEEVFVPCNPGDGCFLDPCQESADCQSGWCVEHMGASVCTQLCSEECPPGWGCRSVSSGPDLVYICVSEMANLCKPCATTEGCKAVGGAEDVCVDYGAEGSFCGGACETDDDCPWGFSCGEAVTVDGVSTLQCIAESGVCPCTPKSIALSLTTPCEVTNDFGTCDGQRVCAEEGLTACDAPVPALETCNGLDDNCDGDVDEALFENGKYVDLCDDGNDCTEDLCNGEAGCDHVALSGDECKDNNPCTIADHCEAGICVGSPVDCDDDNPCTDDSCNDEGGCVFEPNNVDCDDGDPCTVGDECNDGTCAGYGVNCDCQEDADCQPLEDGDLCNGTLYCNTETFPYRCDVADESVILCPEPIGLDAPCLAAACDAETGACSLVAANSGALCDDGDACTIGDLCQDGQCTAGEPANCNDGNLCTDDACDPEAGCTHTSNTLPCNDEDLCTVGDVCQAGACQPGAQALDCDDGNLCTDDSCEALAGCVHTNNSLPCDDGNACTTGDQCTNGGCQAGGGLLPCDDGNPCTDDGCDPAQGCTTTHNTAPCNDGDPCTLNDQCVDGVCVSGAAANCNDNNPCTDDLCGEDGTCQHVANQADCTDGNECTLGDHCSDGACVHSALQSCDDDDVCTTDSCDPAQGCLHLLNQAPCDDGDICTTGDHCNLGECVGGPAMACNDNNPCTDDACDPDAGCQYLPNTADCDDGNACTDGDSCKAGFCKAGGLVDCDDDDPCTDDSCNVDIGCQYSFNTALCDDGDECTLQDQCSQGQCLGGVPLNCNDGDPCTDDACLPGQGCVYSHNSAPCNDGNACTANDLCVAGICTPGTPLDCDDDNVCTADSCDPVAGCQYAPADGPCDDGDACTTDDACVDSACTPGPDLVCDDQNVCTDDSCAPETGCVFVPNQAECSDDNACTDGDACLGGACIPGPAVVCDDANPCTEDSCSPATGCLYAMLPDYTPCGAIEVCIAGECTACPNPHGSQTFGYTGGVQTFTVPQCVTQITVEVWGAQGGDSNGGADGGKGGYSTGVLTVTPGETVHIYVGEKGHNQSSGGWNGGGHGGTYGGGGGGGTDVRQGGTSLNNRKIVAGGGAGGQTGSPDHGAGGYGGGSSGQTGISNQGWTPGGGGTQNSGGSAGAQCYAGSFGSGGSHSSYHVSGGGGGWYGGGCSYGGGGGGGSGYVGGVANGSTQGNVRTGNGQAKFTW